MSGYFELLETELRAAVERTANVPGPERRRVRAWTGGLALAGGVAAALAVALLAVTMLGHARHGGGRVAGSEAGSGSQLRKLLDEYSVLRRPQTAADRSRGLSGLLAPGTHVVPNLMRLATTLRDGEQVFVGVERRSVTRADLAVNSYLIGVWITGPHSYGGATSVNPATDEPRFPWPLGMRRDPRTRAWVPTWVSVVPDGVTSVGWTFFGPSHGGYERRVAITVPVVGNVAATPVAGTGTADLVRVVWKGVGDRTIRAYTPARLIAAAPVSSAVRDVLGADGIGAVKFGASPAAMRAAVDSLLRQPGGAYARGGSCGLDHQIQWWDDRTANGLPLLTVYFRRSKFAGYQYGEYGTLTAPRLPAQGLALATTRGLRIGDTLARGRDLYGRAFAISAAQGGTWGVRTAGGVIVGYAWGTPKHGAVSPRSVVATIDAGDVGCPALSP